MIKVFRTKWIVPLFRPKCIIKNCNSTRKNSIIGVDDQNRPVFCVLRTDFPIDRGLLQEDAECCREQQQQIEDKRDRAVGTYHHERQQDGGGNGQDGHGASVGCGAAQCGGRQNKDTYIKKKNKPGFGAYGVDVGEEEQHAQQVEDEHAAQ